MSGKIINIDFGDNIIDFTADYVFKSDKKIALISGGQRPFLFLKKKLAQKYKNAFFSPDFFTNDDFIEKIVFDNTDLVKIADIEAAFMIFEIIKNDASQLNAKYFALKDKLIIF